MKIITGTPVCVHCQSAIGGYYPIYFECLKNKIAEIQEDKQYLIGDFANHYDEIDVLDILDACCIYSDCCREQIITYIRHPT